MQSSAVTGSAFAAGELGETLQRAGLDESEVDVDPMGGGTGSGAADVVIGLGVCGHGLLSSFAVRAVAIAPSAGL
jgi:hypothetical protein